MRSAFSGVAVSKGLALGRARIRAPHIADIEEQPLPPDDVDAEIARLASAIMVTRGELAKLREQLQYALAQEQLGEFIDLHALILDDPDLVISLNDLIRSGPHRAETALKLQHDRLAAIFDAMDDPYMRSRREDMEQAIARVRWALLRGEGGAEQVIGLAGDVLIADMVAPAEIAQLSERGVVAAIVTHGSPLSHSAILARSLHLPLVVGATQALLKVNDGDVLVIDGASGLVVLEPNAADLRAHHKRVIESKRERRELNRLRREPSRTLDGVDIKLWANAESRDDVAEAHALGAAGVGLYRTEFLFMGSSELPDEETQFRAYRDAVIGMTGRTVTIRTLDLGADKADKTGLALRDEPNPALGLRGVRLSLAREGLLRTQLRAMARASGYGPLRALVPMVSGYEEMRTVRRALDAVLLELRSEGFEVADHVPLGAMIEVPSAAISLPDFIGLCDFLSIGTNDLVQYLLAADRTNEALGELYSPLHPAVLRVLRDVIRIANRRGKPVAVCGEIAGDPMFTPLLLALGIGELSLHPATMLEVRRAVRGCDLSALRAAAPALFRARERAGIEAWLKAHGAR